MRTGTPRSPIRMNCSGKHAGMLLACVVNGWPATDYLEVAHPMQLLVRDTVGELTGSPPDRVAVDGCGAPVFGTSVHGLARAFSALALAPTGSDAAAVADAMRAHPLFVGGPGHPNTVLMQTLPGALAKGGAEGVIAMAAADGTSVAMKIIDGSPRATTMLALRCLAAVGVDVAGTEQLSEVPVLGGGAPVGGMDLGADLSAALAGLAGRA